MGLNVDLNLLSGKTIDVNITGNIPNDDMDKITHKNMINFIERIEK